MEVAGLVHCGVQFCTLPRGVGRSASGLHGAIYIYISIPNCLILVPGSVKKDPGLVSF